MRKQCKICGWYSDNLLCNKHDTEYIYDSSINGYRLKKRNNGSRYTQYNYHKSEIRLTKILENYYGKSDIITSYHPNWAITDKNVLYEYDILIKSQNILIEFNGKQHYRYTKFFHNNKTEYKNQKLRDAAKKELAENNGFTLIIFKYNEPLFKDYILNKIMNNK